MINNVKHLLIYLCLFICYIGEISVLLISIVHLNKPVHFIGIEVHNAVHIVVETNVDDSIEW